MPIYFLLLNSTLGVLEKAENIPLACRSLSFSRQEPEQDNTCERKK